MVNPIQPGLRGSSSLAPQFAQHRFVKTPELKLLTLISGAHAMDAMNQFQQQQQFQHHLQQQQLQHQQNMQASAFGMTPGVQSEYMLISLVFEEVLL